MRLTRWGARAHKPHIKGDRIRDGLPTRKDGVAPEGVTRVASMGDVAPRRAPLWDQPLRELLTNGVLEGAALLSVRVHTHHRPYGGHNHPTVVGRSTGCPPLLVPWLRELFRQNACGQLQSQLQSTLSNAARR